jgi:hypothetical protein
MIIVFFAAIIPAIFLVEIGKSRRPSPDRPESFPVWAGFLAVGLGLLIGTAWLAFTLLGDMGSLVALLLLPSMCALVAESGLYLFTILARLISRQARPYLRWPAGLLLLIPFMLAALGFLKDPYILQVVLFGGALLASGWLIWNRLGRWLALSYAPLLLLSVLAVWATDTYTEFPFLPSNLASIARTLVGLVPGLSVIFSGRLLGWVLADEQSSRWRRLFVAGLLTAPLFLLMAWQAATYSAWDVATDGLGGVFMLELAFVFGVATAIHQSWSLPLKRNAFMFGFVLLILAIIMGANSFGTFGFDGAWGNVPHARTARRAEMINKAVLRYYEQKGQYPQALGDLTPNYLLYLPTPFIIPHQNWCYQGGQDYYRLGYVYRAYFSTPASVKVFAAAGQPPEASWPCEAEAAKYPAPPGYYGP